MNIFLSRSGDASAAVGEVLKDWLRLQNDCYEVNTSDDIPKGTAWHDELCKMLNKTDFGIVCLTQKNQKSTWINFEVGAVLHRFGDDKTQRLSPFMLDCDRPDPGSPLYHLQGTTRKRSDIGRLLRDMNAVSEKPISLEFLDQKLKMTWNQLNDALDEILGAVEPEALGSPPDPVAMRTLENVEELLRIVNRPESLLPQEYVRRAIKGLSVTITDDSAYEWLSEACYQLRQDVDGLRNYLRERSIVTPEGRLVPVSGVEAFVGKVSDLHQLMRTWAPNLKSHR